MEITYSKLIRYLSKKPESQYDIAKFLYKHHPLVGKKGSATNISQILTGATSYYNVWIMTTDVFTPIKKDDIQEVNYSLLDILHKILNSLNSPLLVYLNLNLTEQEVISILCEQSSILNTCLIPNGNLRLIIESIITHLDNN